VAGFGESVRNALTNDLCLALEVTERGVSIGANVYRRVGLGGVAGGADAAAQFWRNASNLFCDRPPENIDDLGVGPLVGGQCPGVSYSVQANGTRRVNSSSPLTNWSINNSNATGPLEVRAVTQSPGSVTVGSQLFGNGQPLNGLGIISSGDLNNPPESTILSMTVTRNDGQPDDCGNVPRVLPDYDPDDFTRPLPVTYDGPGGSQLTVNPTVTYGPTSITNGNEYTVPVSLDFGTDGPLIGEINISTGDINFGSGNSNDDGDNNAPVELPPGEDSDIPGVEIIGVRATSGVDLQIFQNQRITQTGGNPTIYGPRLANVAFQYELPSGDLAWGVDIPIKNTDQVVFSDGPAVDVKGTPELGVTMTLRKIVKQIDTKCC
jgi:hypothetical protein